VLAGIYVMFSLGLSLSWGTLNVLNMAHGATFMFSGFVGYYVSQHADAPFALVAVFGVLAAGTITVLLDQLVFRPIKARVKDPGEAELLMLIGSIGAGSVLLAIAQRATDDSPFGIAERSALHNSVHHIGPFAVTTVQLLILIFGALMPIALSLWVKRSRFGRALRAIAYDTETCELMGVRPALLSVTTMFLAGALAGIAGILMSSHVGALTSASGEVLLIKGFAIIILAGVGSIPGVVVGAVILAGAETLVLSRTSGTWVDAVSFAMLIAVILVRPQGLFPNVKADRV
jgi:branched-chain amino acid transport system permease protein